VCELARLLAMHVERTETGICRLITVHPGVRGELEGGEFG
jgi:hypothetical protein